MNHEWESPKMRQYRRDGIMNMLRSGAVLIICGILWSIASCHNSDGTADASALYRQANKLAVAR